MNNILLIEGGLYMLRIFQINTHELEHRVLDSEPHFKSETCCLVLNLEII